MRNGLENVKDSSPVPFHISATDCDLISVPFDSISVDTEVSIYIETKFSGAIAY